MTNSGMFIALPRSALIAVTLLAGTVTVVPAWAEHASFKDEVFPIIQKYKGLKGAEIVWDAANLDKFLADPRKFLGQKTTMNKRLKGADQRADIIEYMKILE